MNNLRQIPGLLCANVENNTFSAEEKNGTDQHILDSSCISNDYLSPPDRYVGTELHGDLTQVPKHSLLKLDIHIIVIFGHFLDVER